MSKSSPYLGLIEGFFGRTWSFTERHDYAGFLKTQGYHFYIYAPKDDPYLRKSWQQDWPTETTTQLQALIAHYQSLGLDFGLGLSPYEIYKNYDAKARKSLQNKVKRLNQMGVDILCLLFDDMRGDQPGLAQTQIQITLDVMAQTTAKKVIMCPTYYSFDPALETFFGAMPEDYFQDLGKGLPTEVDLFWTGPRICSQDYPEPHLEKVIQLLGRKPFLWDNYPVNDGADMARFLHLKAFENRPGSLADLTAGHAANPMNQPWLSRIPLYSLPRSYAQGSDYDPQKMFEDALNQLCEKKLAQQISKDIVYFQTKGLDQIDPAELEQLVQQYHHFDSPYAKEIVAWLKGEYAPDPDCVTDQVVFHNKG